ncbi:MerR family DNA-binding transcriptional regulator [Nocardia terpenica]|uniref:MerR family DNA-binding transcriptional regulator n=1 Tax=Nocardia terpenica TaxID=455432 RepID=UPI0009ED8EEA
MRALHHYDRIGLLVPSSRTSGGHRCYTQADHYDESTIDSSGIRSADAATRRIRTAVECGRACSTGETACCPPAVPSPTRSAAWRRVPRRTAAACEPTSPRGVYADFGLPPRGRYRRPGRLHRSADTGTTRGDRRGLRTYR